MKGILQLCAPAPQPCPSAVREGRARAQTWARAGTGRLAPSSCAERAASPGAAGTDGPCGAPGSTDLPCLLKISAQCFRSSSLIKQKKVLLGLNMSRVHALSVTDSARCRVLRR